MRRVGLGWMCDVGVRLFVASRFLEGNGLDQRGFALLCRDVMSLLSMLYPLMMCVSRELPAR